MSDLERTNPFLGDEGPFASLACAGLLVVASGRFSHAIIASSALLFVYLFAISILRLTRDIMPRRGGRFIVVLASSFSATLFLLLLSIASPILASELAFYIGLTPIVFVSSRVAERSSDDSASGAIVRSGVEASAISVFMLAFALIREPFGYGSLSLPGLQGEIVVLGSAEASSVAARVVAISAGGLILLGYFVSLVRFLRFKLFSTRSAEDHS